MFKSFLLCFVDKTPTTVKRCSTFKPFIQSTGNTRRTGFNSRRKRATFTSEL